MLEGPEDDLLKCGTNTLASLSSLSISTIRYRGLGTDLDIPRLGCGE